MQTKIRTVKPQKTITLRIKDRPKEDARVKNLRFYVWIFGVLGFKGLRVIGL